MLHADNAIKNNFLLNEILLTQWYPEIYIFPRRHIVTVYSLVLYVCKHLPFYTYGQYEEQNNSEIFNFFRIYMLYFRTKLRKIIHLLIRHLLILLKITKCKKIYFLVQIIFSITATIFSTYN